ncbi:uncharacterized protein [Ptychodera flava]|uniref:uncharacterized protein isoform X2 n=1 Tax=Ptychodera flava TaxID=63121 RepID=UPI00396A5EB9
MAGPCSHDECREDTTMAQHSAKRARYYYVENQRDNHMINLQVVTPLDSDKADFAKEISNMIENYGKILQQYIGQRIKINGWELILHNGTGDTCDVIRDEFEKCCVGKKLYMFGYLGRIGSDHLLLVDSDGTVYRAEDTILHVEGKHGLPGYVRDGPQHLGFYDYYGHLDQDGRIECARGTYADEEKFLEEHFSLIARPNNGDQSNISSTKQISDVMKTRSHKKNGLVNTQHTQ